MAGQTYVDTAENQARTRSILRAFRDRFGGEPLLIRAPGRVNLIGEHTDYNDGYVLPIAIEHDIRFAVRRRADRLIRIYSCDFDSETEFSLDDVRRDDEQSWGNYIRGMAVELMAEGGLVHGMEGTVQGNVPVASGLSSSAAMLVAAGMALLATSGAVVQPRELAVMAQAAETNYVGVRVGIMDPFVSRLGQADHALFLDCRSLEFDSIPIPAGGHQFVVANSQQVRELASSAYNERRAQCEAAVAVVRKRSPAVRALRDVGLDDLAAAESEMDAVTFQRARHVVSENARVVEAVAALREADLARFGQLMNESHGSLRDDYSVSSGALDVLVAAAREVDGCLGSRLTGAGFGGCTVSLVRSEEIPAFQRHVAACYLEQCDTEAEFYVTRPAPGAGLVALP